MLASKADLQTISYPVFIQPKLDGVRALSTSKDLKSRKNKKIETLGHIDLTSLNESIILDGELYAHGLSFQENMKLIKKYRVNDTEKVKYHVYDLPSAPGGFALRYRKLKAVVQDIKHVEVVKTYTVFDEEELLKKHQEFISQGFEGTMIRLDNQDYDFNKRSKQLMKLKDFIDSDYKIIDIVPSDRVPEHGVAVCEAEDGQTFKCGMKLSHEERIEILKDREHMIGKIANVRFFEYTDGGLPRFPVYIGEHIDR